MPARHVRGVVAAAEEIMSDLQLTALLCSRLCHDLIGPIGALNNGIEILADEEDPEMLAQATELLGESAVEAAKRLKFYRLAFGAAAGMGQSVGTGEAREAAAGIYEKGRISLDWPPSRDGETSFGKPAAKLLLNLVLVAASSLPRGGTIAVSSGNGGRNYVLAAAGPGARLEPEIQATLTNKLSEVLLDTHNVVARHAAVLAAASGAKIGLDLSAEGTVRLLLELS